MKLRLFLLITAGLYFSFFSFAGEGIEVAEELLVDLDAADDTAGDDVWINNGTLDDFARVGNPQKVEIRGVPAVQFSGGIPDAYQCLENAPETLIGPDPTRSIEVWVYNEDIAAEETMVAWGKRGGPCGTNMSFNYGTNVHFGAVGHWCWDFQDLGWDPVPIAGQWHYLVYTYDGTTTRVYADGVLNNEEVLGPGKINTHGGTPITLAAQYEADGFTLNVPLAGTLALARVRVHAGVLTPVSYTHLTLPTKA